MKKLFVYLQRNKGDSFTELKIPWLPRQLNGDFINQLDENAIKGEFVANHAPFELRSQIGKEFYRLNANSTRSFTSNEVIMLLNRVENNILYQLKQYYNIQ